MEERAHPMAEFISEAQFIVYEHAILQLQYEKNLRISPTKKISQEKRYFLRSIDKMIISFFYSLRFFPS